MQIISNAYKTMFRDMRSESPTVAAYGPNIPYSHDQMATLHHMWHVQDGESTTRAHTDYMNTEMVKDEPCSYTVDNNGVKYTQKQADLAAEMAAMEKASIDFLTGSYFRNRMYNKSTYCASAIDTRCPPRPVDFDIKTANQTECSIADSPAVNLEDGRIKSNFADSLQLKNDEIQGKSSIACSPKLEMEDSQMRSSIAGTDSQLSLVTEDQANMINISSNLSLPKESKDEIAPSNSPGKTNHEDHAGNIMHQPPREEELEVPDSASIVFPKYCVKNNKTITAPVVPSNDMKMKIETETMQNIAIRDEMEETVKQPLEAKKAWKSRPHKCTLCFNRFVHECSLQKHFEKCCDRKPSKCTSCDNIFSTERYLVVHRRTHTGEKPYSCTTCGQSFSQNDSLHRHQTVHTGETPFICSICDKKFARASYLKSHMVTHSEGKLHMCSECGKSYRRSCELHVHMRCHTNDRRYKCSHCGKGFTRLTTLNDHERIHTGEKPHNCDVCGQSFAQSCALRNHKRTHTGERPYSCSVCGETFSHSGSLYHHKKIHGLDRKPRKK